MVTVEERMASLSRASSPSPTIVWFRRDLRVEDNPALMAASLSGPIIPLYVWSPEEEGQFLPGRVSRWWLRNSLVQLSDTLRALGANLVMRRSASTLNVLLEVIAATGAKQVFYNHLYGACPVSSTVKDAPLSRRRDLRKSARVPLSSLILVSSIPRLCLSRRPYCCRPRL